MKVLSIVLVFFLISVSAFAGVDYACFKACKDDGESTDSCKYICSSPSDSTPLPIIGGGVAKDLIGQVMCGPGQCVRDIIGTVYCSSVPGGGATIDIIGTPVCVGGCVRGTAEYCQNPR
ncbi:MAG: hypothetical protein JZU65_20420 [Chlorobium sp.]|nr:hypothetical protein [Chlorobium sp.]